MSTDWRQVALAGRLRIEASAGTGKTWTIAMLYLRLLLEAGRAPGQILVGTFSEAAAAELRERIRARLREACQVLDGRREDPALADWLGQLGEPPARLGQRLQLALLELDGAAIGTLHGLCRRILAEHPLATRTAGGFALIDEALLHAEIADDLWRRIAQAPDSGDPGLHQLLADGRERLHASLRSLVDGLPALRLPTPAQVAECALLGERAWAPRLRALADDASLFKRANSVLRRELQALAEVLEAALPDYDAARRELKYLLPGDPADPTLLAQLAPAQAAAVGARPEWAFAARLGGVLRHAPTTLRAQALARCRDDYLALRAAWQQRHGLLCFGDLIGRVRAAVEDPSSGLAEALHARWPVALIDEFQDTDAAQYAIVDRVYRDPDGGLRGALLMVGDPKQAIYGFRGGDIRTYQRAARDATGRLELATNMRSSRPLVAALNAFYAAAGDGFAVPGGSTDPGWFGYQPVAASTRRDATPCRERGALVEAPLCLHALPSALTPRSADERRDAALDACAERIASLLAGGGHQIGERPLGAGDIAVLLPTNAHVLALRERLRRRRVPCSGAGRSNVFSTPWAEALQLLLWAWRRPGDAAAVRAALMAPLFGLGLDAIDALGAAPAAWAAWLERFADDARRWREDGVLAALLPLLEAQRPRLVALAEAGERALTDLRHLGELLAAAEAEGRHGDGLVAWLAHQRREADAASAEERQLRIESDAARVQLLTLHASKGLEFPWVMLPLMWDQRGRDIDWPRLAADDGTPALDLGSPDLARARTEAAEEDQRERLRLLYVALTRAVYRVDVWALDPGRPSRAGGRSADADPGRSALDRLLAQIRPDWSAPPPALAGIAWQAEWVQGDSRLPAADANAGAAPLPPAPALRHHLDSLVSFSSLTHTPRGEPARAEDELPDQADDAAPAAAPHPELQAWEAHRGTQVGNALHALLERRDTTCGFAEQRELVVATLAEFGLVGADLVGKTVRRLDAVLAAELAPGLRLGELAAGAQRAELDFRLPLPRLALPALRAACERHGDARLWPAQIAPRTLHGLLNGKIDLVFSHDDRLHVLDYKSNRLGPGLDDYAAARLAQAMDRSAYRFQALLYTVAVHRYLRQRRADYAPGRHLGDSWYLFLRAVGLAPGAGIWRARFPLPLVEAVDAVLAGEEAA